MPKARKKKKSLTSNTTQESNKKQNTTLNKVEKRQLEVDVFEEEQFDLEIGAAQNTEDQLDSHGTENKDKGISNMHCFTQADALKNCGNWVEKQDLGLQYTRVPSTRYPKRSTRSTQKRLEEEDEDEEDCDTPDDLDPDDEEEEEEAASYHLRGRKPPCIKLRDEVLDLHCEWKLCDFNSDDLQIFVKHVSYHVPDVEVHRNDVDEEVYVCQWSNCGFETEESSEIVRHINYHSFHTKAKCIGLNVQRRTKVAPCKCDPDGKNLIPELPYPFLCHWDECERIFNNTQMFLYHVQAHVHCNTFSKNVTHCNPSGKHVKNGVPCLWSGCKWSFTTVYKLADHVRTHTKEKMVACPGCGALFASKSTFYDHCKRQVKSQLYQCSHCSKHFATERLLRDHMRPHVNHYKCAFCDMTCPTRWSLGSHIRYRHMNTRPFKCSFCDYSAKSNYDMRMHLERHYSDSYVCEEENCGYVCQSSLSLTRHYHRFHSDEEVFLYCCHLCDDRFSQGAHLSRHLFDQHNLRRPSGHSRFKYKRRLEDSTFRLQTVRYESLEVTQQMMQSQAMPRPALTNSDNPKSRKNIVISIEQLDDKGNVIDTDVIETQEVHLSEIPHVSL